MKKIALLFFIIPMVIIFVFASNLFLRTRGMYLTFLTSRTEEEIECFDASYDMVSDSMLNDYYSTFEEMGIRSDPFFHILYFIQMFKELTNTTVAGYVPLDSIFQQKASNVRSNIMATCALMQSAGWDVQCFYNNNECYLGLDLSEDWVVRKGNWVEKDGAKYYLKEFDMSTPIGSLLVDEPESQYFSIIPRRDDLRPIPCVSSLPSFGGDVFVKNLIWSCRDSVYTVRIVIPEKQLEWTNNLPPSLYGMAYCGIIELENIGLVDQLRAIVSDMSEFDGVNCLYEFCQSEEIFLYDNAQPIKSVSQQFIDGRNDCDGRSVVLYTLLRAVMNYGKDDVVFLSWPNHIALGVKPRDAKSFQRLFDRHAFSIDGFFILDGAYVGDTQWGDKMARLADTCEIIK